MAIDSYYGKKSGRTVLSIRTEFDDGRPPIVHRSLTDQEAYDTWHLAYYFKDLLECVALRETGCATLREVPHKEKYLLSYLFLSANPDIARITELGCSVFDLIDGLELVAGAALAEESNVPRLNLSTYEFVGIELSDLMSQAARVLHPSYELELHRSVRTLTRPLGFLYDRNVVSYVFETADEVAGFLNRAEVAYANIFFSLGSTFQASRLGKQMTYFSLSETLPLLKKPLFHLFGERAPGPESGPALHGGQPVVEGFFLNCSDTALRSVLRYAEGNPAIESYFKEKGIVPRPAEDLLAKR